MAIIMGLGLLFYILLGFRLLFVEVLGLGLELLNGPFFRAYVVVSQNKGTPI